MRTKNLIKLKSKDKREGLSKKKIHEKKWHYKYAFLDIIFRFYVLYLYVCVIES